MITNIEHFGLSRKITANMTSESWETIPHSCLLYEPEVSEFMSVVKKLNECRNKDEIFTLNTILLKVISEGLKCAPKMNSHIHFQRRLVRGTVEQHSNIDITMPVTLDNGEMITLNIHGLENKNLTQLREEIADTMRRADNSIINEALFEAVMSDTLNTLKKGKIYKVICRLIGSKTGKYRIKTLKGQSKRDYYRISEKDRLTKHDIEQGTITVSNIGSLYKNGNVTFSLLEIIPPQVIAIGIGSIQEIPVFNKDDTVVKGKKLPFTICFDHRALDGGEIVPFMQRLDDIFANPSQIYDWI